MCSMCSFSVAVFYVTNFRNRILGLLLKEMLIIPSTVTNFYRKFSRMFVELYGKFSGINKTASFST